MHTSTWGSALPTVVARSSSGSSVRVWVTTAVAEPHALAGVVGVVQKIAVRQLDASRPCRRAGRVLEKHRVVGVDALLTAAQHVVGDAGRRRERVRPREDAGRPTIVEERYPLQLREAPARDVPRTGAGELGATAAEERQLIDVAGTLAQEERGRIRVLEDEREIVGAAQGIDRDQHCADLRGRELDEHPLRPVRRPERDVVAALDPEPDERGDHVALWATNRPQDRKS